MTNKVVLVVAAHPDDEALGCAGTLARHILNGDIVQIVFMSDGVTSREGFEEGELEQRNKAALKCCEIIGITLPPIFLRFPDNRMDSVPLLDLVQPLETLIIDIKPEVVYTHHVGDLNIDHQITNKAVMTACRPQPKFSVREIYSFEILSSTEWSNEDPFVPNYFVDITDTMETKILAINSYVSELKPYPHARSINSIKALAKYRGASVGLEAAESFKIQRLIKA